MLAAMAGQARGAVDLADGDARSALVSLRHAWQLWHDLEAPYETALVRVLVGLACRALGDDDTAGMDLEAARPRLMAGSGPDLADVSTRHPGTPHQETLRA